jgi:GDP-mannose 6-dehydrogenase
MTIAQRNLSIFGLGYVGSVSAAGLASLGHRVTGVDVDPGKVEAVNRGAAPVIEPGLDALLAEQHRAGRLRATTDAAQAVQETDTTLVCVGTPSAPNGSLDLSAIDRVCEQIGQALRRKPAGPEGEHLVVIRSTLLPGAVESLVIPALERASGRAAGAGFLVAHNPEFLREGTALDDFLHPPKTVIGAADERAARRAAAIYERIDAPLFVTTLGVASALKYAENAFHAAKITFGNEIGMLCAKLGIDSHEVMRLLCEDRTLNISPAYLRPAFAFGGSCLPKDLRAVTHQARTIDLELPMLASLLDSNRRQVQALVDRLLPWRREGIGILGISFKPGTDDLRESPMVTVVETLLGRGAEVRVYDPCVRLTALVGSNLRYVTTEIPHIGNLLRESAEAVVRASRAIVVAHRTQAFRDALSQARPDQVVFDLVRLPEPETIPARYVGLHWPGPGGAAAALPPVEVPEPAAHRAPRAAVSPGPRR